MASISLLAWALFLVSFFLPSYMQYRGWECARMCLQTCVHLREVEADFGGPPWLWPYVAAFTAANLMMLLSPLFVFSPWFQCQGRALRCWFCWGAALHALSWLPFNIWHHNGHDLKAGYFMWAASFGLLFVGLLGSGRDRRVGNRSSPEVPADAGVWPPAPRLTGH